MPPFDDDEDFSAAAFSRAEKERKLAQEAKIAAEADPEYRAILEKTRRAQADTVDSSDNAVRTLRETRKVSESTKTELDRQGEQLKQIKESADRADSNVTQAYENTRKIDKYSHFIPVMGLFSNSKKKKEDKALEKEQKHIDKDVERQAKAAQKDSKDLSPPNSSSAGPRREFSDDSERRIDENLDEMSLHLRALKQDATYMQTSISDQDVDIRQIQARTTHTQNVMEISDKKLQRHL